MYTKKFLWSALTQEFFTNRGGGNAVNESMDRSRPPLRWMVFESVAAGLRTKLFDRVLKPSEQIELQESLVGIWWILEMLPLERLTYTREKDGTKITYKWARPTARCNMLSFLGLTH